MYLIALEGAFPWSGVALAAVIGAATIGGIWLGFHYNRPRVRTDGKFVLVVESDGPDNEPIRERGVTAVYGPFGYGDVLEAREEVRRLVDKDEDGSTATITTVDLLRLPLTVVATQ